MALKAIPTKAEAQAKKKPAAAAPGTWKLTMPGRITAEDAEAEPRDRRLFPDA